MNDEMKTAMKKKMKINEIFWDYRVWCSEWVWKMDQKSLGYGDMVDWKNPGFEPEGKRCCAGFEPRNASLFLNEPTLKNW